MSKGQKEEEDPKSWHKTLTADVEGKKGKRRKKKESKKIWVRFRVYYILERTHAFD